MDRLDKLEQDAQALLAEARDLLATITTEERNAAPEEDTRFSAIEFEVSCLAAEYESLKRARDLAEKAHADLGKPGSTSGSERGEDRGAPAVHLDVDPFDADTRARIGEDEAAKRSLERSAVAKNLPAENLEEVERKLNAAGLPEMRGIRRHVLAFGSDAYGSAFVKMANQRQWDLTDEEKRALHFAESEARAMGLTDGSGGALIPTFLDPTVINTSDGSINPYRQIARTVQVAGDNWNGVTSAGISIAWGTEFSVVGDNSPAFGQPSITPYKAHGFVPISIEGYEDIAGAGSVVAGMFQQAKDDDEAEKFATGSGTNQPTGIITALAGGVRVVASATNTAISAADLFSVQQDLGPRYQQRASWTMNLAYVNRIRQLGSSDNYFAQTVRLPDSSDFALLGRPAYQASGQIQKSYFNTF